MGGKLIAIFQKLGDRWDVGRKDNSLEGLTGSRRDAMGLSVLSPEEADSFACRQP